MKVFAALLIFCGHFTDVFGEEMARLHPEVYEAAVKFSAFSYLYPDGKRSSFNDNFWRHGCVPQYNFTFISHGWNQTISSTPWIKEMIQNFLALRGNCVIFMDYSKFSSGGYFDLVPHFDGISAVLKKKIASINNPENTVLFGFSFGARLVIDSGFESAKDGTTIDKIYACDPAGPGFQNYNKDPRKAANFVQCIHTSSDKGTTLYDCDQNWRLGDCGNFQIGAQSPPMGSHGLCPYFFNKSFYFGFVADNFYNCPSNRLAKDLPSDLILGPSETRISYVGDIFAPTAKNPPWNVVNDLINN